MVIVWKEVGETPLECLERYRSGRPELADVPMTYAGRLDPMAEGELLILTGEECKNKERWLGLDKEYEIEIVFGIETDTYDALGLGVVRPEGVEHSSKLLSNTPPALEGYVGRFVQEYPAYSSKAFSWKGDEPPTKEVEIYSIETLSCGTISAPDLKKRILGMIEKVRGDFRQAEIVGQWQKLLREQTFNVIKIRVKCSSGTYMRSLAHRMGGFALTIKRTKIFIVD